jgi:WD40 repeat protein
VRILQATAKRPVSLLAFGAGRLVAGGTGGFDVWDLSTGEQRHVPSSGSSSAWPVCAVDPRGRWFCTTDTTKGCRLFPLGDVEGVGRLPGRLDDQRAYAFAVSPDGGRAVVSRGIAPYNRLECWEAGDPWRLAWAFRDGKRCGEGPYFSVGPGWWSFAVAFSPDGGRVAALERRWDAARSRSFSHLILRDVGSGKRLAEAAIGETRNQSALHFLRDGKRLAVLSGDAALDIWAPPKKKQLAHVRPRGPSFQALAVHPSGRFIATAEGTTVVYRSADTLRELKAFRWGVGKPRCLAFSEDGTLGAAGGDRGQVALWDIDD